jgi:peptide/nickel transport system permease protein
MRKYILRRLSQMVPVVLITTFIVFSLTLLIPGDPAVTILGEQSSQADRDALREELGFNEPLPIRYGKWLVGVATGDMGRSLATREPVAEMLVARIPVTLQLTLQSVLLALLVGLPLGIIAAARRNTWLDVVASTSAMTTMAIPYFWVGILLIMFFSIRLAWLPPSGFVPLGTSFTGNLTHMLLPTLTVGLSLAGLVMRQMRTSMLQVLSQDYIRTAKAKGVSPLAVILKHGLRNALIPVITVVGLQAGALVGGAVVTESVFGLPGLGRMIVEGIFQRDFPVVQGGILIVVFLVLIVNLLTDLSYSALDKRIKL